jgi:hypothetical protein
VKPSPLIGETLWLFLEFFHKKFDPLYLKLWDSKAEKGVKGEFVDAGGK